MVEDHTGKIFVCLYTNAIGPMSALNIENSAIKRGGQNEICLGQAMFFEDFFLTLQSSVPFKAFKIEKKIKKC